MSARTPAVVGRRTFLLCFAAVTLLIAGVVSYAASSAPDGLDSTTLRGCEVVETAGGESLTGSCMAQEAGEHALSGSPLADYSFAGMESSTGPAGIVGVTVTLVLAGGVFWLIARFARPRDGDGAGGR